MCTLLSVPVRPEPDLFVSCAFVLLLVCVRNLDSEAICVSLWFGKNKTVSEKYLPSKNSCLPQCSFLWLRFYLCTQNISSFQRTVHSQCARAALTFHTCGCSILTQDLFFSAMNAKTALKSFTTIFTFDINTVKLGQNWKKCRKIFIITCFLMFMLIVFVRRRLKAAKKKDMRLVWNEAPSVAQHLLCSSLMGTLHMQRGF